MTRVALVLFLAGAPVTLAPIAGAGLVTSECQYGGPTVVCSQQGRNSIDVGPAKDIMLQPVPNGPGSIAGQFGAGSALPAIASG